MINSLHSSIVSSPPPLSPCIYSKGDSAASAHYFREQDKNCLTNVTDATSKNIILPDGSHLRATHKGFLPLSPSLSSQAREAHILPNLQSASLISIGKLCDDGCRVQFGKHSMNVFKNNDLILQGTRNIHDGLYDIPIRPNIPSPLPCNTQRVLKFHKNPSLSVIIQKRQPKADLVRYLHAACFSPTLDLWIQ